LIFSRSGNVPSASSAERNATLMVGGRGVGREGTSFF
jgi:hypothetical protein